MLELVARYAIHAWVAANRMAGYALLNLIDDPAILAMGFC
jgi:hypothetical protein